VKKSERRNFIAYPHIGDSKLYSLTRLRAEKILMRRSLVEGSASLSETDFDFIFQELQLHQIELELQLEELHQANFALEREKGKLGGIYDVAPVGYFILDLAGVVKDVNEKGCYLLQAMKWDVVGKRLQTFVNNTDEYYRFFMRMLKAEGAQHSELEFRRSTGDYFHVKVEGIARSIAGDPMECFIAITDISERIRSEHELAETRNRLELALNVSLAGTWAFDVRQNRFFLDEGSQRIFKIPGRYAVNDIAGFLSLIHPEHRAAVEQAFRAALSPMNEINLTCRLGGSDDCECYAVIRGHLINSEGDQRLVGIILDVTEKTLMERSAGKLKEEYRKKIAAATLNSEENERKRISEALHDSVSQLLYGIKIQLDQLEKLSSVPSPRIKSIKGLLGQAIEETRNISFELAPSILADFGLPATLEELAKRLTSEELRIYVKSTGVFKRMDLVVETNIYRIIQELVNNCMKHSHASQIHVELHKNKSIEIMVCDNGRGFDVSEQEKAATGSGLSSIRNRLNLYNGSMMITSETGVGTRVLVILPNENPIIIDDLGDSTI
jgi:PAS domain S-box-containing protein